MAIPVLDGGPANKSNVKRFICRSTWRERYDKGGQRLHPALIQDDVPIAWS